MQFPPVDCLVCSLHPQYFSWAHSCSDHTYIARPIFLCVDFHFFSRERQPSTKCTSPTREISRSRETVVDPLAALETTEVKDPQFVQQVCLFVVERPYGYLILVLRWSFIYE